jgi:hypothetical protein
MLAQSAHRFATEQFRSGGARLLVAGNAMHTCGFPAHLRTVHQLAGQRIVVAGRVNENDSADATTIGCVR